jgi:hypothetical protein
VGRALDLALGAEVSPTAGAVIVALRDGPAHEAGDLLPAAADVGLVLDQPHAGAVIEYDGPLLRTWVTAMSWLGRPAHIEGHVAWLVIGPQVEAELSEIRLRLESTLGAGQLRLSCGPVVADVTRTGPSFADAATLMALLRARPGTGQQSFRDAGLTQLLLAVPRPQLHAFVAQHLGPLLERPELIETLQWWLATNGSRIAVAARLHLHRNSVGYRVGLIKALLQLDPLEPASAGVLQAALGGRELLLALEASDNDSIAEKYC